jgi:hypothetical protein
MKNGKQGGYRRCLAARERLPAECRCGTIGTVGSFVGAGARKGDVIRTRGAL